MINFKELQKDLQDVNKNFEKPIEVIQDLNMILGNIFGLKVSYNNKENKKEE